MPTSPETAVAPISTLPLAPKFNCAAERFVRADPLPLKFAVIVPAEKFPDASRLTIVFAVLALVAEFAALRSTGDAGRRLSSDGYHRSRSLCADHLPEPRAAEIIRSDCRCGLCGALVAVVAFPF